MDSQPYRPVLGLPTPEGWKAELILVAGHIARQFTCPQTVTHPGTNQTWCRATTLRVNLYMKPLLGPATTNCDTFSSRA